MPDPSAKFPCWIIADLYFQQPGLSLAYSVHGQVNMAIRGASFSPAIRGSVVTIRGLLALRMRS